MRSRLTFYLFCLEILCVFPCDLKATLSKFFCVFRGRMERRNLKI